MSPPYRYPSVTLTRTKSDRPGEHIYVQFHIDGAVYFAHVRLPKKYGDPRETTLFKQREADEYG